jgi:hypothetical protein
LNRNQISLWKKYQFIRWLLYWGSSDYKLYVWCGQFYLISEMGLNEWTALHRKTRNVLKAAFRPGTFKNLKTQLNTYLLFCEHFNRLAFPIDQETLCGYACFLAEHFKSSGSVRNYLSCIKTWTVLLKFYVEELYSPTLKMTLSGAEILNTLEW